MPAANPASSTPNSRGAAQRVVRGAADTPRPESSVFELDPLRDRRDLLRRQEPGSTATFVEDGGGLAVGLSEGRDHECPGDEGAGATDDRLAGQIDDVQ